MNARTQQDHLAGFSFSKYPSTRRTRDARVYVGSNTEALIGRVSTCRGILPGRDPLMTDDDG